MYSVLKLKLHISYLNNIEYKINLNIYRHMEIEPNSWYSCTT